jgi:hypothetical protein
VRAYFWIAPDFLVGRMHQYSLVFQVSNPPVIVLPGPGQFHDHDALFAGEYGRLEDIESEIEFTGKKTDNRFLHFCSREAKKEHPGVHADTSI